MAKIAFVGAGSFGFTRKLVADILSVAAFGDADIALYDIDEARLSFIERAVRRIVEVGGYTARVTATLDRDAALAGADGVVITILSHGVEQFRHDIEIPKRYGVDTNIGDTRGPSGIFRALRTIPVMLDIAGAIERQAPHAVVLNYTNPMPMVCRAVRAETGLDFTGLCHSVQGTSEMLARWIGAPYDEVSFTCAGINHQAWFLQYQWRGEDAYPLLREAVRRPEVYNEEQVRNEMFLHLDYYVTESSGHASEYVPWFRKREDLIEKYCTHGTNWNPGEYAFVVKRYEQRNRTWRQEIDEWLAGASIDLNRSNEYASRIFDATLGSGERFEFNGNLPNAGLIDNLPAGCCVEVPVMASPAGLEPVAVGGLPPQLAILTGTNAQIEELAVAGCLQGDRRKIQQAVYMDPLTAAVCSLDEIDAMVDELFAANRAVLPTFANHR